jgi:cytochrome c peroxidase
MKRGFFLLVGALIALGACQKDEPDVAPVPGATPLALEYPSHFPDPVIPANNPTTVEGVALGRRLFYEKRLSGNNTMACADCHLADYNYADFNRFSTGIDGIQGNRNAMAVINLAWQDFFFWDGRSVSMEEQAGLPVEDPIEMHATWPDVVQKLSADPTYRSLFKAAFGSETITRERATKAIAQFERTMISGNSKFDRFVQGLEALSVQEAQGYAIFNTEIGDCFHCHGDATTGYMFGAFGNLQFSNNGLDSVPLPNSGRERVTGNPADRGKFKIPTLRNVEFSFPYMHDGRFNTLEEVIDFYNTGGHPSPTIDPNMKAAGVGRNWSAEQKQALVAFLKTLSDTDFITDPRFSDPDLTD